MTADSTGVVIDTNLWVSMALGSRVVSEQMLAVIASPVIRLYVSVELLDELTETLAKPKIQKYLIQERTRYVVDLIWLKAEVIKVANRLQICRDHKDDFIVNLAVEAKAQYVLTGDDDLLSLRTVMGIELMTIADFIQKMGL